MAVPPEEIASLYATPESDVEPQSNEALWNDLVVFAGDPSYAKKWRALHTGRSSMAGFNFPAFFFGLLWYVYRRMYLYGVAILIAPWVIGAVVLGLGGRESLLNVLSLTFAILSGFIANPIYYYHARRRILDAALPPEIDARQAALEALGKTNGTAVWVLASIAFVLGFLVMLRAALYHPPISQ